MNFSAMIQQALEVKHLYAELESTKYGRNWTVEEIAMGLVGDVGDLMKLVQGKAGIREIPDLEQKLAHEIADCLWSLIVLADLYSIDIQSEFVVTMDQLKENIKLQMQNVEE